MRTFGIIGALLVFFSPAGCGTVAKMGYKSVVGVDTNARLHEPIATHALASYGTATVGQVDTDVSTICSDALLAQIRHHMRGAFAERLTTTYPGNGRSLTVDVDCRYHKRSRRFRSEGRLDVLVHLKDTETGKQVGRFHVEAINTSPMHAGDDHLAEAVAKEIAKKLVDLKRQSRPATSQAD
jgi:hypothetical protein